MKGKTNALAKAGSVGKALVTFKVTTNGYNDSAANGVTVTLTNKATGEEIVQTWQQGDKMVVMVDAVAEYTITLSTLYGYKRPSPVTLITVNDVTYDYVFNYTVLPTGVYILTTTEEFILAENWNHSYEAVGIYVGYKRFSKVSAFVLAPEIIRCKGIEVNSSNYNDLAWGYNQGISDALSDMYRGLKRTRYFYEKYPPSQFANYAHVNAWEYKFKNGAQGWIPDYDNLSEMACSWEAILYAYEQLGKYYGDINYFAGYGSDDFGNEYYGVRLNIWSSTPAYGLYSGDKPRDYGWKCAKFEWDEDGYVEEWVNYTYSNYPLIICSHYQ